MDDFYYVYMLAYPDGIAFYIGKGKGDRIFQHEEEARKGHQCQKCDIIRSIWANGEQVMRVKVQERLWEREALCLESYLIHGRSYPRRDLTNKIIPIKDDRFRAFRTYLKEVFSLA